MSNDYRESLIKIIPEELYVYLPRAFDVIGTIAILRITHPLLLRYKHVIGNALIKALGKRIKTVAVDYGVKGDWRVRKLEVVAGNHCLITEHREYGLRLAIDLNKVYYSPRLAYEHKRIAELVKPNEIVIDMFTGIGPFALMIGKYASATKIYAIDINPHAIEFLKLNLARNKVRNVIPLLGDIREVYTQLEPADRIIMNLPHASFEYLPIALQLIKPDGCTVIHYHELVERGKVDKRAVELKTIIVEQTDRSHFVPNNSIRWRKVRHYSSSTDHICFDIIIYK